MIPAYLWDQELEKRIIPLEQRIKVVSQLGERIKILELEVNKLYIILEKNGIR